MDCFLAVIPTYACNFNCSFCLENKNKTLLDLNILRKRLMEIPYNVKVLTLLGGEISILPENYLNNLLKLIDEHHKEIAIITNGYKIIPQFLDQRYRLNISWDFEARPHSTSVYSNIISLDRNYSILTVCTKELMSKPINEIINFYNSLKNMDFVQFQFLLTTTKDELSYYKEFLEFRLKIINHPRRQFNVADESPVIGLAIDPDGYYTFTKGPMHGYFGDFRVNTIEECSEIYEHSCKVIQKCVYCIHCDSCLKHDWLSDELKKLYNCNSAEYLK